MITSIKNKEDFDRAIGLSKIALFDFTDPEHCAPCKALLPVLEKLEKEYEDKDVRFFYVDVNDESTSSLKAEYKIFAVPTLICFKSGSRQRKPIVGLHPERDYKAIIETLLKG